MSYSLTEYHFQDLPAAVREEILGMIASAHPKPSEEEIQYWVRAHSYVAVIPAWYYLASEFVSRRSQSKRERGVTSRSLSFCSASPFKVSVLS
jgi:hypothetical protein